MPKGKPKPKPPKPKKTSAEAMYGDASPEAEGPSCGHERWWTLGSGKNANCIHDECNPIWPPLRVDVRTGKPIKRNGL